MCSVSEFRGSTGGVQVYSFENSNKPAKHRIVETNPPILIGDQWDQYRDANNLYRCARAIENYAVKVCENPGKIIGGMIGLLSVPVLFPLCVAGSVKHGYQSLLFAAAGVCLGAAAGELVGWVVGKGVGKLCSAPFYAASHIWDSLPPIRRQAY